MLQSPEQLKTQTPSNEQLTGMVYGDERDPRASEARAEVQAIYGDMEKVGGTSPESHIDLHEEEQGNALLDANAAEAKQLAITKELDENERLDAYTKEINAMPETESIHDIGKIGILIYNTRVLEAATEG